MRNSLLLVAVVVGLLGGQPALGQYVYLDVNGDGVNSHTNPALPDDVLNSTVTSVDVYFATNENRDGSPAVCAQGPDPFSIISYDFTLHAAGSGTVTYGTWTENMGFGITLTPCSPYCMVDPDIWVGRGSGAALAEGTYKVGTLAITVTGTPTLDIVPGSATVDPVSQTAFGSNCLGNQQFNTIILGDDFFDSDGTEGGTPVLPATWGQIKELYR